MVSGWAFFRLSNIHLYFHFRTINECQWIFTKLSMCINIVEIWYGITNGRNSSIFYRVTCPQHVWFLFVSRLKLQYKKNFTKLRVCIDIVETWFWIFFFFFFFFFWFGFYGPFKNISLISSRSFIEGGRKPENPEKNHLTIRKQNLAFPHMTRARLEPQRWET